MSEKLLPCPFCGGEANKGQENYYGPWTVWCENHDAPCTVFPRVIERSEAEAIAAWNTRAAMQADAAPVAWMYERGQERKAYVERSQAALACGYAETPLYAHPPVADRVSTSIPVDDCETGNTSDKDLIERVALNLRLAGMCHTHTHSVQTAQAAIAAMQADAAPVAWMYTHEDGSRFFSSVRQTQPFHDMAPGRKNGWTETPLYAHPPVDNRVSTSSPVDDRAAPETSGKLQDAVEVWGEIKYQTYWRTHYNEGPDEAAVAIIEADREAVRAEQAAELAKWRDRYNKLGQLALGHISDLSTDLNRVEAELAKFKALVEALAGALEEMQSYGCPVCNGDCGSANPPVMSCPMSQSAEALRQYKESRDAS